MEPVELDQAFRSQLRTRFEIFEANDNGHSLFNSLAMALDRQQDEQADIRMELTVYYIENVEIFDDFLMPGVNRDSLAQELMSTGGEAGGFAIRLASLLYNRQICVIQEPFTVVTFENPNASAPTIYLSYHLGNHYNMLRPNVQEPLASLPATPALPENNQN